MRRLVLSLRSPTGYFAEFVGLRASAPTYIRLAGYQVIFREIRLSDFEGNMKDVHFTIDYSASTGATRLVNT